MNRSVCVHCAAALWRGIDRDIGQVFADVLPLTVEQEAGLLLASIRDDGWRRRRLSYDILTTNGRDAPELDCRAAWKPGRPRGYVVITHRCGQPPAAKLPVFSLEVTAGEDDPPFSPGPDFFPAEHFFPPYADFFSQAEGDEPFRALALLAPTAKGMCALCGLRVEKKTARLCNRCSPFAHGRIYDASNTPVLGWCEVGRHRRRTAARNTSGQWDCGRHTPARNTSVVGARGAGA